MVASRYIERERPHFRLTSVAQKLLCFSALIKKLAQFSLIQLLREMKKKLPLKQGRSTSIASKTRMDKIKEFYKKRLKFGFCSLYLA